MGFSADDISNARITAFVNGEDGAEYSVWKAVIGNNVYVLKQAKQYEAEVYSRFLREAVSAVPKLYSAFSLDGEDYLLMQYIEGSVPMRFDRVSLVSVLDALIYIQDRFWEDTRFSSIAYTFEKSLESRIKRGKYLGDSGFEHVYARYLDCYNRLPRTLCHDDLLPFNTVVSGKGAFLLDWEIAGMLPYPTPIARLLAHGEEDETAFFYITDADKRFAVDYYFNNFIKHKNIPYGEYIAAVKLFFFYEYCEWIMLGNKHNTADSERCRHYTALANSLSKLL